MSDNESESADRKYDYIAHATIKPPKFLDTSPSAYFCLFEAQFDLQNITSSATKFYIVVAALPSEVVGRLSPAVFFFQMSQYGETLDIPISRPNRPFYVKPFN